MNRQRVISEVPQEEDISSISNQQSDEEQEQDSHFRLDKQDEEESFDMDDQPLRSKGIKIVQRKPIEKENQPPPQKRPQSANVTLPKKSILKNKSVVKDYTTTKEITETETVTASPRMDFKPVYTTSYNSYLQRSKKYDYTQKNFNTLVKKSDRVARYQQMNTVWKKTTYLKNGNTKEGRKLNLEDRIKLQKEQQRVEGIFHRYVSKSELFM